MRERIFTTFLQHPIPEFWSEQLTDTAKLEDAHVDRNKRDFLILIAGFFAFSREAFTLSA